MSLSRRQFFRGLVGQGETRQPDPTRRTDTIDSYVRTNLLPYDFSLTAEQTERVLEAVRNGMGPGAEDDDEDLRSWEKRSQMNLLADEILQPMREEFWKAEETRREALIFVREFLTTQAAPEDMQKLRDRFHIPHPLVLEDEVERQVQSWLAGLSNAHLSACERPALRELVFSELKSWC